MSSHSYTVRLTHFNTEASSHSYIKNLAHTSQRGWPFVLYTKGWYTHTDVSAPFYTVDSAHSYRVMGPLVHRDIWPLVHRGIIAFVKYSEGAFEGTIIVRCFQSVNCEK